MRKYRHLAFWVALSLLVPAGAAAHDVWVAPGEGKWVVMWGHGDKSDPYRPEQVQQVQAYDAAAQSVPVMVEAGNQQAFLRPQTRPAFISLVFASGPWVKTPEGYKNLSKREAKDALESFKSVTYNKNLWQWHPRFGQPLGGKMELVPLQNPLSLKPGDRLPIQVLYEGKPLAGVVVSAPGVEKGSLQTDAAGKALVPIQAKGLVVVKANQRTPTPQDPDADMLSETASLVFTLP